MLDTIKINEGLNWLYKQGLDNGLSDSQAVQYAVGMLVSRFVGVTNRWKDAMDTERDRDVAELVAFWNASDA